MKLYKNIKNHTENELLEELIYASTKEDCSLGKCISRVNEMAKDDKLIANISTDFAPHSFYFAIINIENDSLYMNGGIIWHKSSENGKKWQIHT